MKTLFYFKLRISAGMIENLKTSNITLIPTTFRSTEMFQNVGIFVPKEMLPRGAAFFSSLFFLNPKYGGRGGGEVPRAPPVDPLTAQGAKRRYVRSHLQRTATDQR